MKDLKVNINDHFLLQQEGRMLFVKIVDIKDGSYCMRKVVNNVVSKKEEDYMTITFLLFRAMAIEKLLV